MTPEERAARRARARDLRLAGHSRSQIARAMGLKSGGRTLDRWLQGLPPPEWTKRPRAKDEAHAKAMAMRLEGHSYREIQRTLNVSRGTLSVWLRDLPLSPEHEAELRKRNAAAAQKRATTRRALTVLRDRRIVTKAAGQIPPLDRAQLFVAGVVAYWAEGTKNKPWRRGERVIFVNSDPGLVALFLRWLDLLGVDRERLSFRVQIHERADVAAALNGLPWSEFLPIDSDRRP